MVLGCYFLCVFVGQTPKSQKMRVARNSAYVEVGHVCSRPYVFCVCELGARARVGEGCVVSRAIRILRERIGGARKFGGAPKGKGEGEKYKIIASRPGLLPPQSITIHMRMLRTLITRGCFFGGRRPGRFSHVMLGTTSGLRLTFEL